MSLAGHPEPERFVAEFSGSDRTVAEYLLAEMLDRQPVEVQQLLLRTSVLDRVNGELADLLTSRPGSERVLLELEDANALVVSLDTERTWFRYHHLFSDLLRLQLRRTLPEEVPALHRRAAEWLKQHGHIVDAIRHAQAAGEWPEAARLLADHALSLTLDGQAATVQALARSFPPGASADPELALVLAAGELVHGHLDEAAAQLAAASSHAEAAPPNRGLLPSLTIASLQLWLARRRGDLSGVLEQAQLLDGAAPVTGTSTLVEAHLLAALAHSLLDDQRAAHEHTERALALAEPDRLALPFATTGAGVLLENLPRQETAHAALFADLQDVIRGFSAPSDEHPMPPAETLSPGELRVLRYLPTHLTRPEIADELSVSVNTIGTHLRRIYAKLGADDRNDAVRRARELRLLSAARTLPAALRTKTTPARAPGRLRHRVSARGQE
jgi:ATP/maltotriose-dependent transcriptional regulator MalT